MLPFWRHNLSPPSPLHPSYTSQQILDKSSCMWRTWWRLDVPWRRYDVTRRLWRHRRVTERPPTVTCWPWPDTDSPPTWPTYLAALPTRSQAFHIDIRKQEKKREKQTKRISVSNQINIFEAPTWFMLTSSDNYKLIVPNIQNQQNSLRFRITPLVCVRCLTLYLQCKGVA